MLAEGTEPWSIMLPYDGEKCWDEQVLILIRLMDSKGKRSGLDSEGGAISTASSLKPEDRGQGNDLFYPSKQLVGEF